MSRPSLSATLSFTSNLDKLVFDNGLYGSPPDARVRSLPSHPAAELLCLYFIWHFLPAKGDHSRKV